MICKNCGATNTESNTYCVQCGQKLTGASNQSMNLNPNWGVDSSTENLINQGVTSIVSDANVGDAANQNNNMNQNVGSNSKDVHSSIVRRSIKMDAKKKPKKLLIAISVLTFLGMCLLMILLSGAVKSSQDVNLLTVLVVFILGLVFGVVFFIAPVYASIEISRGNEPRLLDCLVYPLTKLSIIFKLLGLEILLGLGAIILMLIPILGVFLYFIAIIYLLPVIMIYMYTIVDKDQPSQGVISGFKEALTITKGHHVEFYALGISFIGWYLLSCLTCGILFLWVGPYIQISFTNYYRHVMKEQEYNTATPGLSDISLIVIAIVGYVVAILLIIALFLLVGFSAFKEVSSSLNNTSLQLEELQKDKYLYFSIPAGYTEISASGYDEAYQNAAGDIIIGKIQQYRDSEYTIEEYANSYKNEFESISYVCTSQPKRIKSHDWILVDCSNGSVNLKTYLAEQGSKRYLMTITSRASAVGVNELAEEFEKELEFSSTFVQESV